MRQVSLTSQEQWDNFLSKEGLLGMLASLQDAKIYEQHVQYVSSGRRVRQLVWAV